MQRLFVPPERIDGSDARLDPAQAHYLRDVVRLPPGSKVEVFDGRGARWGGTWDGTAIRLAEQLPPQQRAADLVLAQALAKGEKMDLVVQKATELGASRIVPLRTDRAVVRLDAARGADRAVRWRRIAQEAARQCGRADVPEVDPPRSWDELIGSLEEDRRGLLLDPEERELRLSQAARGVPRLLLVVGPEGGFSPEERERAREAGLLPVGLGPVVLRTETAGLAALAIVQHLHGELG